MHAAIIFGILINVFDAKSVIISCSVAKQASSEFDEYIQIKGSGEFTKVMDNFIGLVCFLLFGNSSELGDEILSCRCFH